MRGLRAFPALLKHVKLSLNLECNGSIPEAARNTRLKPPNLLNSMSGTRASPLQFSAGSRCASLSQPWPSGAARRRWAGWPSGYGV